jgi:hypothetical protein
MSVMHDASMVHAVGHPPTGPADSRKLSVLGHRRIVATSRCSMPSGFLRLLYPDGVPSGRCIILWSKGHGKTSRFSLSTAAEADRYVGAKDLYVHACLGPPRLRGSRLKGEDAVGLAGVWLDVDVVGGPAGKRNAAPDLPAAVALGKAILQPTAIVNSGYGLHLWWLFDEPLLLGVEAEREQAERISRGWQGLHQRLARQRGFRVDSCFDLARLMRLPGTVNGKDPGAPVPVTLLDDDGPRHGLEAVARLALPAAPACRPKGERGAPRMNVELPILKFRSLLERNARFRATWRHDRPDLGDTSLSGYDMALVAIAARAGWTDDELGALIREHRTRRGDTSGKGEYVDYLARTIRRAREPLRSPSADSVGSH